MVCQSEKKVNVGQRASALTVLEEGVRRLSYQRFKPATEFHRTRKASAGDRTLDGNLARVQTTCISCR